MKVLFLGSRPQVFYFNIKKALHLLNNIKRRVSFVCYVGSSTDEEAAGS